MNTLITVAALGLIGLGDSGVGILNSAWGLGGLLGALGAVGLASRQRLGPWFAFSMVLWGLPLAIIGVLPLPLIALGAMFASGVGNATLDVSVFTLLQRSVRSADRMAVFVLLEAIAALGIAVGSILGPLLLAVFGDRGALIVAGAIMPVAIVATWSRVRRVDEEAVVPEKELSILRGIPMFARLPLTALERLAEGMRSSRLRSRHRHRSRGRVRRRIPHRRQRTGRGQPGGTHGQRARARRRIRRDRAAPRGAANGHRPGHGPDDDLQHHLP